jgi:hypothetical protein
MSIEINGTTEGDMEAYKLLLRSGKIIMETHNETAYTDAGNFIIELAARIQAQRLAIAARNQRLRKI